MKNTLLKYAVALTLSSLLSGCWTDRPYNEVKETSSEKKKTTNGNGIKETSPEKKISYAISGTVSLTSPLSDSIVQVFTWADVDERKLLAESTTDDNGRYELKFENEYSGSALLVVSFGNYADNVAEETVRMSANDELSAPVSSLKKKLSVHVNAWTTLATSNALSMSASSVDAIEQSLEAFGKHLGSSSKIDLIHTGFCEAFVNECNYGEDGVVLSLSQIGLSRIAADSNVTLISLVSLLSQDISDGQFNGLSDNEQLYLDAEESVRLTQNMIRYDLAQAIDDYIANLPDNTEIADNFSRVTLSKDHELYHTLSSGMVSQIFSKDSMTKRFLPSIKTSNERPFFIFINHDLNKHRSDPHDLLSPDVTLYDTYNSEGNSKFPFGFGFLHAYITHLSDTPTKIRFVPPAYRHDNFFAILKWKPNSNPSYGSCYFEQINERDRPKPIDSDLSMLDFKYFDYESGEELDIVDGYITLQPKQSIEIKWYAQEVLRDDHWDLLKLGQLPTDESCLPNEYKKLYEACEGIPNEYFLDHCKRYPDGEVQYLALRDIKITTDRDYLSFRFQHGDNKSVIQRIDLGNEPFRTVTQTKH